MATRILIVVMMSWPLLAAEPKEYKKGALDRWETLSAGTDCSTNHGILGGTSTHCGDASVRAYHILTEDGYDYMIRPDSLDPLKAVALGQEITYRIDEKGLFWTPDPKNGLCPWPCTGEKKREFKESGNPNHEAKYLVNLVERRKVDSSPTLINRDIVEMSRLGLSEALIIQKINTSKTGFDVSISALTSLKESGISDTVIAAMMERQNR